MHKATFSPLGLAVYEPSSHQPQRGWPSQHARRPSDPKGLTECFSAVAFCCRNPLKGDWPRYALHNPQPLRGWRRSVAAILNPFGVGLATRCTTLNPFGVGGDPRQRSSTPLGVAGCRRQQSSTPLGVGGDPRRRSSTPEGLCFATRYARLNHESSCFATAFAV